MENFLLLLLHGGWDRLEGRGMGQMRTAAAKKASPEKVITAIALGAGAALCLVGLVVGLVLLRPKGEARFRGSVREYLAPMRTTGTLKPGELSGKMVVVDADAEKLDPVHYQLPATLRAQSAAEVRVSVRLQWEKVEAGSYVHQTGLSYPAVRQDCRVQVIDKVTAKSASTLIRGILPAQTDLDKTTGPKPTEQVVQYLVALSGTRSQ
jgi:hypothetical protein